MLKALTWRFVASLDTLLIVWLITGSLTMGASVSIIEVATKIVIYYLHERAWIKIDFWLDKIRGKKNG